MKVRLILLGVLIIGSICLATLHVARQGAASSAALSLASEDYVPGISQGTELLDSAPSEQPSAPFIGDISRPSFVNACHNLTRHLTAEIEAWELEQAEEDDRALTQHEFDKALSEALFDEQIRTNSVADELERASDPEILLYAALQITTSGQPEQVEANLHRRATIAQKAVSSDTRNPTLVFAAFQLCSQAQSETACNLDYLTKLVTEVDGDNTQVWSQIALNRHRAGDLGGALEALDKAASSQSFNNHLSDTARVLLRAMPSAEVTSFPESSEKAIHLAQGVRLQALEVASMCQAQSRSDAWANACLDYGAHVSSQDPGPIKYGRLIQLYVHEAQGNKQAVEALEAQHLTDNRKDWERLEAIEHDYQFLALADPYLFDTYLRFLDTYGDPLAALYASNAIHEFAMANPELDCIAKMKAEYPQHF